MSFTTSLTTFAEVAATSEESKSIFASLGIDWTMILMQSIAFLILVWALAKFVYPIFFRVIDERQEKIEASTKAAEKAEEHAEKAQAEIEKLLAAAKKDAADIVATAHDEAIAARTKATEKAKAEAEQIVADAHQQIEKDVVKARNTLRNDTVELVALATRKVVGDSVSPTIDDKLVQATAKEMQTK